MVYFWCVYLFLVSTVYAQDNFDIVQMDLAGDIQHHEDRDGGQQPLLRVDYDSWASVKKIWYINLDKNNDRRNFMEQQLQTYNIPGERLAGINITNRSVHWSPEYDQWLKVGASDALKANDRPHHVFSVWLSQNAVFHKIAALGDSDDLHMMLEDDCQLAPGWEQAVRTNMKDVPADWDVVRWSTWHNFREADLVKNAVYRCIGPSYDKGKYYYMGNHAVMTTPKRAKRLLEYFGKTKIFHADALLAVAFDKGLNSYAIKDDHFQTKWFDEENSVNKEGKKGDQAFSEEKPTDPFLQQLLKLFLNKVQVITTVDGASQLQIFHSSGLRAVLSSAVLLIVGAVAMLA